MTTCRNQTTHILGVWYMHYEQQFSCDCCLIWWVIYQTLPMLHICLTSSINRVDKILKTLIKSKWINTTLTSRFSNNTVGLSVHYRASSLLSPALHCSSGPALSGRKSWSRVLRPLSHNLSQLVCCDWHWMTNVGIYFNFLILNTNLSIWKRTFIMQCSLLPQYFEFTVCAHQTSTEDFHFWIFQTGVTHVQLLQVTWVGWECCHQLLADFCSQSISVQSFGTEMTKEMTLYWKYINRPCCPALPN